MLNSSSVPNTLDHQSRRKFAWQGWQMEVPADWNPLILRGDKERGEVSLADLSRTRLAFRWTTPSRNLDVQKWAAKTLREEIGTLAAGEAREFAMVGKAWQASTLYVEPKSPGRDVWVGQSLNSGRLIEIVYSLQSDTHRLSESILPTLGDTPASEPTRWCAFDLSCETPAEYRLASQLLNAGDLSLAFSRGSRKLVVRQIALAKMALARRPLAKWLKAHDRSTASYYAANESPCELQIETADGVIRGVSQAARLRQRFAWMWWLPREQTTLELHDTRRDRIVIVQASEESVARAVAASVGQ